MTHREHSEAPDEGPLDRPGRGAGDPIGEDAYPGGGTLMPPTGDMDDPIPETGMPGEPEPDSGQYEREEGIEPTEDERA